MPAAAAAVSGQSWSPSFRRVRPPGHVGDLGRSPHKVARREWRDREADDRRVGEFGQTVRHGVRMADGSGAPAPELVDEL